MALISYEQLEDGFDASANLWNERFGKIYGEFNGNIDSANLKNGAVTREKIATGAVTSDKIATDRYIDENGWTVNDLGTTKTYSYTIPVNQTIAASSRLSLTPILPPVGRTNTNIVMTVTWFGSYSGHAIPGVEKSGPTVDTSDDADPQGDYIGPQMFNSFPGRSLAIKGNIQITAVEAL